MANKRTVALTEESYKKIITIIREGFTLKGTTLKPNDRIATVLVLEANLGIRIGDILKLHMSDIKRDGDRFKLDIFETKTGKYRGFTVPSEIYSFIQNYAYTRNIKIDAKLFDISERAVQKHLKLTCEFLGYSDVGTHSFRKYFSTKIYKDNGYNIELVRVLLQHSSIATTQKYIGIQTKEIETALNNHVQLL